MGKRLKITTFCLAAAAPAAFLTLRAGGQQKPVILVSTRGATAAVAQPDTAVSDMMIDPRREPWLSHDQTLRLLRKRVRYVFVLYQENRSFDSYFGTFPGADGLYSRPANQTPGFFQPIRNRDGTAAIIQPFRIGPREYAADINDPGHSHPSIFAKMHVVGGIPQMDRYALTEELSRSPGGVPTLTAKQMAELTMAHVDGDTIPFLWRWANRFVLFDQFFQEMTGPSTPGNLSIIGAQTGVTQWMLHPDEAFRGDGEGRPGVPVLNSDEPFWGSPQDTAPSSRMPFNPGDYQKDLKNPAHVQRNLTYASLPLTLGRQNIRSQVAADEKPDIDLADVKEDIGAIASSPGSAVDWGWYQEGYDREPSDDNTGPLDAEGRHASYVTHHNGPSFFGYVSNNARMRSHLHGLQDFALALRRHSLPPAGGVFYVKGGYQNLLQLQPADPDPRAARTFLGDDDHPGYSDSQISEAMLAETINQICNSPYWPECAILIAWDDSAGEYDHVRPPVRSSGPDSAVLSDGARVPLMVISPYSRAHAIVHDRGDHASVVKFVDALFGLRQLATLPDERRGREIGRTKYHQANLGPFDADTPHITDLFGAFDPARLLGRARPLPAWYARIPESLVHTLPQQSGYGWRQVGVVPVDYARGIPNTIPPDFNPRPVTEPTLSLAPRGVYSR